MRLQWVWRDEQGRALAASCTPLLRVTYLAGPITRTDRLLWAQPSPKSAPRRLACSWSRGCPWSGPNTPSDA